MRRDKLQSTAIAAEKSISFAALQHAHGETQPVAKEFRLIWSQMDVSAAIVRRNAIARGRARSVAFKKRSTRFI